MHRNEPYSYVSVKEFSEAFQSFHVGRKLGDELAIPFDRTKSHPDSLTTDRYGVSKKMLLKACVDRELLLMKRNSFVYIFKEIQVRFACTDSVISLSFLSVHDEGKVIIFLAAHYHGKHIYDSISTDGDA